jgi:hypothetical protein
MREYIHRVVEGSQPVDRDNLQEGGAFVVFILDATLDMAQVLALALASQCVLRAVLVDLRLAGLQELP